MGVINGKAGKAAKFLDKLTLSQPGGGRGRLCPTIGFASPKFFRDYVPGKVKNPRFLISN